MGEEVGLKPCPFCGGSRIGGPYRGNPDTRLHYFACVSTPGVSCASVFGLSPEQARERWNRRAAPAEESSVEAEDGLDTPLPCDVQIAHIRYRKGVKLRTLVNAAARWHALASAACPLPAAPAEARTGQPEGEA